MIFTLTLSIRWTNKSFVMTIVYWFSSLQQNSLHGNSLKRWLESLYGALFSFRWCCSLNEHGFCYAFVFSSCRFLWRGELRAPRLVLWMPRSWRRACWRGTRGRRRRSGWRWTTRCCRKCCKYNGIVIKILNLMIILSYLDLLGAGASVRRANARKA